MSYQLVNIAKLTDKVRKWNPLKEDEDISFRYFDLSCIDKEGKKIIEEEIFTINKVEAPSRARQLIRSDDILVSTVRPNLNGLAKISLTQPNDTASTGFCVLRTNEELNNNYLFYWLQSKKFVNEMIRKATGASYPAVSDKTIRNSKIPLPPLKTQKRIAQILDDAAALRDKTQQLLKEYDLLAQSIFLEMFGDPVNNPKKWVISNIKEVAQKIQIGPFGSQLHKSDYIDNGFVLLNPTNIINGKIDLSKVVFINNEKFNSLPNYHLKSGDILMARRGDLSKIGLIDRDNYFCGTGSLYIRLGKKINSLFALFILSHKSTIDRLYSKSRGITMANLNKKIVNELKITVPPINLQNQFAEKIALIEKQKELAKQELKESEDLFNCLLQKAFKGELV